MAAKGGREGWVPVHEGIRFLYATAAPLGSGEGQKQAPAALEPPPAELEEALSDFIALSDVEVSRAAQWVGGGR